MDEERSNQEKPKKKRSGITGKKKKEENTLMEADPESEFLRGQSIDDSVANGLLWDKTVRCYSGFLSGINCTSSRVDDRTNRETPKLARIRVNSKRSFCRLARLDWTVVARGSINRRSITSVSPSFLILLVAFDPPSLPSSTSASIPLTLERSSYRTIVRKRNERSTNKGSTRHLHLREIDFDRECL